MTGMITRLGFKCQSDHAVANEFNPKGYFECRRWDNIVVKQDEIDPEEVRKFAEMMDDKFGDWILKHAAAFRWRETIDALKPDKIILLRRDVESLQKSWQNMNPAGQIDDFVARLKALDDLKEARPDARVFVFPDYVDNKAKTVKEVAEYLGVSPTVEALAFLSADLVHFRPE
jgi:hypothetical protein